MAATDVYTVITARGEKLSAIAEEDEVNNTVRLSVGRVDKTDAVFPVVADEAAALAAETPSAYISVDNTI